MASYVRDLVMSSRYFSDVDAERLSYFLHVPVDGIVLRRLKKLGVRLPFNKTNGIDARGKFYSVQELLTGRPLRWECPAFGLTITGSTGSKITVRIEVIAGALVRRFSHVLAQSKVGNDG